MPLKPSLFMVLAVLAEPYRDRPAHYLASTFERGEDGGYPGGGDSRDGSPAYIEVAWC